MTTLSETASLIPSCSIITWSSGSLSAGKTTYTFWSIYRLPVFLYRLQLKVQQELDKNSNGDVLVWSEFMVDLWKKHLPHLREELYGEGLFVYNANTGCYGFQEEKQEEPSCDEKMATDLQNAAEINWNQGEDLRLSTDDLSVAVSVVGDTHEGSSDREPEVELKFTADPEASALPEDCKCMRGNYLD